MVYGIWRLYLLLIIAAGSTQGQPTSRFYDSSNIIFPGKTERPSKFPLYETTTTSFVYKNCFKYCQLQSTSEYEPVCGTDNIGYSNLGNLQCARNCGKDVDILEYGPCKLHNPRGPESNAPTSTPSSGIYGQCLNSCLSSDEYNPVCGTDGIVYSNIEKLRCAQDCGKEVEPGRCVDDSRS